jgi:hypothetical protein
VSSLHGLSKSVWDNVVLELLVRVPTGVTRLANGKRRRQGRQILVVHRNDAGNGYFRAAAPRPAGLKTEGRKFGLYIDRRRAGKKALRRVLRKQVIVILPSGMRTARSMQLWKALSKHGVDCRTLRVQITKWQQLGVRREILSGCTQVIAMTSEGIAEVIKIQANQPQPKLKHIKRAGNRFPRRRRSAGGLRMSMA